jgi:hypothetical protein
MKRSANQAQTTTGLLDGLCSGLDGQRPELQRRPHGAVHIWRGRLRVGDPKGRRREQHHGGHRGVHDQGAAPEQPVVQLIRLDRQLDDGQRLVDGPLRCGCGVDNGDVRACALAVDDLAHGARGADAHVPRRHDCSEQQQRCAWVEELDAAADPGQGQRASADIGGKARGKAPAGLRFYNTAMIVW